MHEIKKVGIIFENEVAEKLKDQGFIHVKVTKASRDYGADILAFKDGLEYVIQCKKYKGTVGFNAVKDIATAMDIYQADRGILICDTAFSKDAYKAVERIDKPIELIDLEEIKTWKVRKVKPVKYKPHSYQKSILAKLIKHRRQGNNSALLVMATGLGKTLVAAWDLKNQIKKGEKALFLVHRKDILVDNAEKFHAIINQKKEEFRFGIYFAGKKFKGEDIVFSTFQTIIKHYRKIPKNYFNYIIIDEAHHSPAPTYAKIFSYFNPKFILGITATPKRLTKADNDFINDVFGKPLVDLDLARALINGYLSPVKYSVFCDNIDYDKLKAVNRKLSVEQLNQSYFIPTKDEDIERIIYSETERIKNPKAIIFCPSIKYINSIKLIGLFKDAEVYHSNMSDFDRSIIFRRFKLGKIKSILVVDLFNEGIDIPDANIIVFLRTTYSPTIFFQQLGRGLRKIPGKRYLRVLDFVGALSKIRKVIDAFGHLLIIQDFIEKVEKQRKLSNIYHGKIYKDSGSLEPFELDFYQAEGKVKHKEIRFKKRDFLREIKFLKKHLIKSEGWTEEEIINELKPICEKFGHFPGGNYLIRIGRSDLTVQIARNGGVYYFANKMGYRAIKKPSGHWTLENLRRELLPICKQYGKVPDRNYLRKIGRGDLERAIQRLGGKIKIAKELGYSPARKRGYWTLENLSGELKPICKEQGKMPSGDYLRKIGRQDLERAIYKFGRDKVAERLGYTLSIRPKGYWILERAIEELKPICEKLGRMPSDGYLRKIGKGDLEHATYRIGKDKIAKRLGYKVRKIHPGGYWTLKNVKNELLPICRKLSRMPTKAELKKMGRPDIIAGTRKFGWAAVAGKLNYKTSKKPQGYWDNFDNVNKELLPICKKLKKMPNWSYLERVGRRDLNFAIKKCGGRDKVAKRLGYCV